MKGETADGQVAPVARATGRPAGARSYDHLGNGYEWRPREPGAARWALDVERVRGRTPPLARGEPEQDFLHRWTRAEVLAKLLDLPAVMAWRDFSKRLDDAPGLVTLTVGGSRIELWSWRSAGTVFSVGRMEVVTA